MCVLRTFVWLRYIKRLLILITNNKLRFCFIHGRCKIFYRRISIKKKNIPCQSTSSLVERERHQFFSKYTDFCQTRDAPIHRKSSELQTNYRWLTILDDALFDYKTLVTLIYITCPTVTRYSSVSDGVRLEFKRHLYFVNSLLRDNATIKQMRRLFRARRANEKSRKILTTARNQPCMVFVHWIHWFSLSVFG